MTNFPISPHKKSGGPVGPPRLPMETPPPFVARPCGMRRLFGLPGFEIDHRDMLDLVRLKTWRLVPPAMAIRQLDGGQGATAFTAAGKFKLRRLACIDFLQHADSQERGFARLEVL